MLKSLQSKMVLILTLLIIAIMTVVSTVLLNGITNFYADSFENRIEMSLTQEMLSQKTPEGMYEIIEAHAPDFGINNYRAFFILNDRAEYLYGSDAELGKSLEVTPNLLSAANGAKGNKMSVSADFMDYAVSFGEESEFILYFRDSNKEMADITWMMITIVLQGLAIALVLAVVMSYILAKAITGPIKGLTQGAKKISSGDFTVKMPVYSKDEIGVLSKTFTSMADILKDTLGEIESERNKLETMFLYLADGVVAFNSEEKVIHINKAAMDILDLDESAEMSYDNVFNAIEDKISFEELMSKQEFTTQKTQTASKSLELYYAVLAAVNEDEGEKGIIAVIHDITEQQKLEQSRREFIANVSHELRTPLTSIKGAAETLLENPELPAEMKERFLTMAISEADRMTRIVKDLLSLSRLDSGKIDWSFKRINTEKFATHVYEVMQIEAHEHNHSMTLSVEEGIADCIIDSGRIEQVLVNILSNSIKYTPNGGKINFEVFSKENHVHFSVKDNGIGIPNDDVARLFERFYRVDKARSRENGGTGLGLAIANEIVKTHNGRIEVESIIGKGTRMTVILPMTIVLPLDNALNNDGGAEYD